MCDIHASGFDRDVEKIPTSCVLRNSSVHAKIPASINLSLKHKLVQINSLSLHCKLGDDVKKYTTGTAAISSKMTISPVGLFLLLPILK